MCREGQCGVEDDLYRDASLLWRQEVRAHGRFKAADRIVGGLTEATDDVVATVARYLKIAW